MLSIAWNISNNFSKSYFFSKSFINDFKPFASTIVCCVSLQFFLEYIFRHSPVFAK